MIQNENEISILKETWVQEMPYGSDRVYSYFLREHLPCLTQVYKKVIEPQFDHVSLDDWCEFAFAHTSVSESILRDSQKWND